MLFKVLAVGDVTGESGVDFLRRKLRPLKKEKDIDFVAVNGENAAGNGLLPAHAEDILAAGADVITLGNHAFGKAQVANFLEENPYILRPANFTGRAPGLAAETASAACTRHATSVLHSTSPWWA